MYNYSEKDKEYFKSLVDFKGEDECWEFKGTINKYGYGKIFGNEKEITAHRFSYFILYNVELPIEGYHIDHICYLNTTGGGNRKCINPKHLRQVPPKVNLNNLCEEGIKKRSENGIIYGKINGLKNFGENCGNVTLTAAKALEIYNLKDSGRTQQSIADEYNIVRSNIWKIWNKKAWKCIH
jgi:hypothetical protein